MNAQSTGTVSINSSNPNGSPVIDPKLLSHAFDRRVMAEAVKNGLAFLENPAVKPFIKRVTAGPKSTADEDIEVSN
jgi:choline dehydrogenase-like flavoprotein